jgi:hypothetical protein
MVTLPAMEKLFADEAFLRRSYCRERRPEIESLEDRIACAAAYTWVGGNGENKWSDTANWRRNGEETNLLPGPEDDITFDGESGETDSIVDIERTVNTLIMKSGFTNKLVLNENVNLTADSAVDIDGPTITGAGKLTVGVGTGASFLF